MNERDIYAKTEAGREEIRTRALHLSGALRTVLLLVDGHRHVYQLMELMSGGKAPKDALQQLLALGLIELRSESPSASPASLASTATATLRAPVASAEGQPAAALASIATKPTSAVASAVPSSGANGVANAVANGVANGVASAPPAREVAAPSATPPDPAANGAAGTPPQGVSRFNRLYAVMNEIVSDYLGLRGYFMQLKIEKCSSTEELLALQEELGAALAKAHGRDVASELVDRIEASAS